MRRSYATSTARAVCLRLQLQAVCYFEALCWCIVLYRGFNWFYLAVMFTSKNNDRHRRSGTATTGGGRTPPSSIAGDALEESAEEWREQAERARRERREAELGRKKAEDARDEVEEKARKYEAKIRQLLGTSPEVQCVIPTVQDHLCTLNRATAANRELEKRLARSEKATPPPPPSVAQSDGGSSRRNDTPNRRASVNTEPAKAPARLASRAPELQDAGGDEQPALDGRSSPPMRAPTPTTQAPVPSSSRDQQHSHPPASGTTVTISNRRQTPPSGHGPQDVATPEPQGGPAISQDISLAPASRSRRTPRQVEKAVPPLKPAQMPARAVRTRRSQSLLRNSPFPLNAAQAQASNCQFSQPRLQVRSRFA